MANPINYQDALLQMQEYGLEIDALELHKNDFVRCRVAGEGKEKRGWYRIFLQARGSDGAEYIVGKFGCWRGCDNDAQSIALRGLGASLTTEERSRNKKIISEAMQAKKAADAERIQLAAEQAHQAWNTYKADGQSDYLKKKGVQGYGVRYGADGELIVPVRDTRGKIYGLQIIRGAAARGTGKLEKEFFPQGMAAKGHFHMIGAPSASNLIIIAEGYATAASVFEAAGYPVAVAFYADNLFPVGEALRRRYPKANLLFCADDDAAQKCRHCKKHVWLYDGDTCPHCGEPHGALNKGVSSAKQAALALCRGERGAGSADFMVPCFPPDVDAKRRETWMAEQ